MQSDEKTSAESASAKARKGGSGEAREEIALASVFSRFDPREKIEGCEQSTVVLRTLTKVFYLP